MRIAQMAPLIESVPPRLYGGTERVVSYLTEELVRLGHEVTLFASGDSRTAARLVAGAPAAIRLDPQSYNPIFQYTCVLDELWRRAGEFDVFHFHLDVLQFPLFRPLAGRTLTTLHGRLDLPHLDPIYQRFAEFPLVSISDSQRKALPNANYVATVHHGLPLDLFPARLHPRGGYLAFVGRISPEKGVDRAIEIARRARLPLRIAAKVDPVDEAYFRERIAPLLDGPGVEFIGEVADRDKGEILGDALALLFPIDWPEPFGLAMIEAMACGTPVLAFRNGSVDEVIDEGITGVVASSVEEATAMVPRVTALDRHRVRRTFETRFSARRMAEDYVRLYEQAVGRSRPREAETVIRYPERARAPARVAKANGSAAAAVTTQVS